MKYQVTLHNPSNINISSPRTSKKIIDVDPTVVGVSGNLSDLEDVDTSSQQNNYVLVWNSVLGKHEYVSPFEVMDRADNVDDDMIDYGTY